MAALPAPSPSFQASQAWRGLGPTEAQMVAEPLGLGWGRESCLLSLEPQPLNQPLPSPQLSVCGWCVGQGPD